MIPSEFLSRMETLLGPEYQEFLRSYDRPLQKGLRLGQKASGRSLSLPFSLEPVPWAPGGFSYDPETRPGKHPYLPAENLHSWLIFWQERVCWWPTRFIQNGQKFYPETSSAWVFPMLWY